MNGVCRLTKLLLLMDEYEGLAMLSAGNCDCRKTVAKTSSFTIWNSREEVVNGLNLEVHGRGQFLRSSADSTSSTTLHWSFPFRLCTWRYCHFEGSSSDREADFSGEPLAHSCILSS
ncbi:hypothetical protein R1flu_016446 [Riccia fluitans]|uniref:Uncharacterized protein n=1 Tax=Riccia fluitans TaxID=41844 RepID=A0ABD1YM29_9MARC